MQEDNLCHLSLLKFSSFLFTDPNHTYIVMYNSGMQINACQDFIKHSDKLENGRLKYNQQCGFHSWTHSV